MAPSAHDDDPRKSLRDTFARDHLPPRSQWPELVFERPELQYPPRLNCAAELLDRMVAAGHGERPALWAPVDGRPVACTYRQLLARANRIARALTEDLGLVPGNRVLLRGPNNPMMAACWLGIVKAGGIAYLDEIVEARKDTTVVIHPLTDDRRILPLEKKGEIVEAPDDFLLVISYNPGYQSVLKDLKHSTKQRFVAIEFDYPPADLEQTILQEEAGIDADTAQRLVKIAEKVRNLRTHGLEEGVSTRLLVYAGQLIHEGIEPTAACESTICKPITDDVEMQRSILEIIATQF